MWCLSEVNYSHVDLKQYLHIHHELNVAQNENNQKRSSPPRGLSGLAPPSGRSGHAKVAPETALASLREAFLFQDPGKSRVPSIIANWPLEELRLSAVLRPEEVRDRLRQEEQLWSWLFQGLAARTARCRLTTLDLTGHRTGDGLVYLLVGVTPLLALAPQQRTLQPLSQEIQRQLGIKDTAVLKAIDSYLKVFLNHKTFSKDRRMVLVEGSCLDIIFDFFPISKGRLAHLSLLTAVGLAHLTRVNIVCRTAVVSLTATYGNEEKLDSSLGVVNYISSVKSPCGLLFDNVNESVQLDQVLAMIDNNRHLTAIGVTTSSKALSFQLNKSSPYDFSIVHKIESLTRLEFKRLDLTGILDTVLHNLPTNLQYLGIPGCKVCKSDFRASRRGDHLKNVLDLNLADLEFSEDGQGDENCTASITNLIESMNSLVILNIAGLCSILSDWDNFLLNFHSKTHLQVLVLNQVLLTRKQADSLLDACLIHLRDLRKLLFTLRLDNSADEEKIMVFKRVREISQSTQLDISMTLLDGSS